MNAGTDEIKSEIERTRVEMSETIGEIQERLRPDHLIQQAKDTVTEAATGKVRNMMQSAGETAQMVAEQTQYAGRTVAGYVRTHPLQMALLAGGVTWWLLRDSYRSRDWEGASESARAKARRATARVRSAAATAGQSAGQRWRQASTSVDDWVHEYPFAAGALAVAVGAAVGLSAPATAFEDRAMGETRDRAWETAGRKAREVRDDVTKTVHDVAETVIDATTPAGTSRPADPALGRT